MEALTDEWVEALVGASAAASDDQVGERSGIIELVIGKNRRAVVSMVEGRVVGPSDAEGDDIDVSIPFSDDQLRSYLSGEESIAQAYIRGDVKPVGSSGPWLSFVELVESGALRSLA